jgi:hypothetical protein
MQAQTEALRQAELAKIPIWTGSKSLDQFSAEQWVERIQRARDASTWTDVQTMSFVFNALRSDALLWYDSLKRSGIDQNTWAAFKTAFLQAYSTIRTTRSTIVNLADVRQGPNESVVAYYPRVVKAIDDLESLVAPAGFAPPANPYHADIVALGGFGGLADAVKDGTVSNLIKHGATSAFNHMGLHLFLTNLKPMLRDELLKTPPATLYEAFQQAVTLERIQLEPRKTPQTTVAEVDQEQDSHSDADEEAQIAELSNALKKLKAKRAQSSNSRNGRNTTQQRAGATLNPNYNKCRYCKKVGHIQKVCNARIKAGAPMVDKDGKPYRTINEVADSHAQQQHTSNIPQAPQQQQHNFHQQQQHFAYNPFAGAHAPPFNTPNFAAPDFF